MTNFNPAEKKNNYKSINQEFQKKCKYENNI